MQKFKLNNNLKSAAWMLIVNICLEEEEKKKYYEIFDSLDIDGDGLICNKELEIALKSIIKENYKLQKEEENNN
jgi:Ca2+-binding EF-hand superfamily protein